MEKTFDLTGCLAKVGSVSNQEIAPNNFDTYIAKIKKSVDSCRVQFGMTREFCGHRDGYDACKLSVGSVFCKLENCPLLR